MEPNGDAKIHSDVKDQILRYFMLMVICFSFSSFFVITALVNIIILQHVPEFWLSLI